VTQPEADSWQPSQLQLDRIRYRRSRTRRSVLIALVSTVVVLGAIVLFVGHAKGWPDTQKSFFDVRAGWDGLGAQIKALWLNIQIMLISEVCVLVFGAIIALLRTLQGPVFFPLRMLATVYVDLFRGIPLLIVIYLVVFGIPSLHISYLPKGSFTLSIVALTLTYTAYVAEVMRAGIQSVHPSQASAARSLGLTHGQSMRYVIFPQGLRRVLPPLLNDFVSLQKDTSLVSIGGAIEVVLTALNQQSQDFKFVHYVVAALIFVALSVPLTRLTDWIARRQGWVSGGAII